MPDRNRGSPFGGFSNPFVDTVRREPAAPRPEAAPTLASVLGAIFAGGGGRRVVGGASGSSAFRGPRGAVTGRRSAAPL